MSVKVKKQLVSKSIANEMTYGTGNKKQYIVEHETANTSIGANAQSHANLQSNGNSRDASWHYQVDDKNIIQSFDEKYRCWHAGGSYNNNSIGIEICVNSDGDFNKAVENASKLTRHLMKKYNIPITNVITHKKASGWKPCPQFLLSGSKGVSWSDFVGMLTKSAEKFVEEKVKSTSPSPQPKGNQGLVNWMNNKGMDSSQANRQVLATQYGISGYDFSAQKNIELLNALQKGKPKTNSKAKVKKGAKVTLSNTATEYATGEAIPKSVKGKTYTVQQVKKNQVLLKEIVSWVYSWDIVGNGAAKSSSNSSNNTSLNVGNKVTLSNSAKKYATGQNIPNSVKGKSYTVQQIKGSQVLLKEIYSWVYAKDVGGTSGVGNTVKKSTTPSIKVGSKVTATKLYATGSSTKNVRKSPITGTVDKVNNNWRNEIRLKDNNGNYIGFTRKRDLK